MNLLLYQTELSCFNLFGASGSESNQRPIPYKGIALTLSYKGKLVGVDSNALRALTSSPLGTDLQSAVRGNTLCSLRGFDYCAKKHLAGLPLLTAP